MRKPRLWAYSTKAWFKAGLGGVGLVDDRREVVGDDGGGHPPKNAPAASHPSITASVVWEKLTHTKQCRLKQAVKTRT